MPTVSGPGLARQICRLSPITFTTGSHYGPVLSSTTSWHCSALSLAGSSSSPGTVLSKRLISPCASPSVAPHIRHTITKSRCISIPAHRCRTAVTIVCSFLPGRDGSDSSMLYRPNSGPIQGPVLRPEPSSVPTGVIPRRGPLLPCSLIESLFHHCSLCPPALVLSSALKFS
jgi:hypothetical protein